MPETMLFVVMSSKLVLGCSIWWVEAHRKLILKETNTTWLLLTFDKKFNLKGQKRRFQYIKRFEEDELFTWLKYVLSCKTLTFVSIDWKQIFKGIDYNKNVFSEGLCFKQ